MTHLLERHHHCQRVNQEQRSNQKPLLRIARTTRSSRLFSYHSRHSCWQYKTLVMAVDAYGNEIGQRCDQSLDSPFDPCQGQSDSPPVSLREQQVTSSDSLRGQSAMPRVSALSVVGIALRCGLDRGRRMRHALQNTGCAASRSTAGFHPEPVWTRTRVLTTIANENAGCI